MADDEQPEQAPVIRLVPPAAPPRNDAATDAPPRSGGTGDVLERYRFPPLPLLSGTAVPDPDGTLRPIAQVAVVVTASDGSEHRVLLEPRYGGWWPPSEG